MCHRFLDRLKQAASTPLLVAHRGASTHAPENSLESARLGRDAGAEAWELDVQLTRDGVAVVLHDESLVRTTDVARRFDGDPRRANGFRLSDFDWSEVRALDAGSWFLHDASARTAAAFGTLSELTPAQRSHYESGQVRVPTLREALELTRDLDWLVNVELKSFPESPPGLVESVAEEIRATDTGDRVLISSFDHRDLARMAAPSSTVDPLLAALPRGALVWAPLHRPFDYLTRTLGAHTYHVSAQALGSESIAYRRRPSPEALRRDEVEELRSRGVPVLVYTVNDARPGGLAEHLAALGVSALFTDDPGGMRQLFESTRL